ncbi:hypothetical protein MRB53_011932 [Persea americana]|uniref:Uncharacterized protein n=1 Tax=Persea americana TaxID=3435 RepID=A0ACC2LW76_PERAE|nr:hypothetical protein MRB53_011932 [Persea americana]
MGCTNITAVGPCESLEITSGVGIVLVEVESELATCTGTETGPVIRSDSGPAICKGTEYAGSWLGCCGAEKLVCSEAETVCSGSDCSGWVCGAFACGIATGRWTIAGCVDGVGSIGQQGRLHWVLAQEQHRVIAFRDRGASQRQGLKWKKSLIEHHMPGKKDATSVNIKTPIAEMIKAVTKKYTRSRAELNLF